MSKRQLNGLAWTLLVLTVVVLAANVVLGGQHGPARAYLDMDGRGGDYR
jgi:hypothetical protein